MGFAIAQPILPTGYGLTMEHISLRPVAKTPPSPRLSQEKVRIKRMSQFRHPRSKQRTKENARQIRAMALAAGISLNSFPTAN
jgi:hypothetical protein